MEKIIYVLLIGSMWKYGLLCYTCICLS